MSNENISEIFGIFLSLSLISFVSALQYSHEYVPLHPCFYKNYFINIILHHPKAPFKLLAFGTDRCRSKIPAGSVSVAIGVQCWQNMLSTSDGCA
jgi:hypothetical protein